MDSFTTLTGVAAPLEITNVDTDMIIPKQYLKTIKRTGSARACSPRCATRTTGNENPDFVLNKPAYRKAQILVAGDNFGCGSSREHAPWALLDFGIRCVISHELRRHLLQQLLQERHLADRSCRTEDLDKLMDDAERGANADATDRPREPGNPRARTAASVTFEIDAFRKHCLLNGLDDIGLTMEKAPSIATYEAKAAQSHPWL